MSSQDKRGISIMIGYVLLVGIAIIMSLIVYQFIKTYVPKESIECPDEVSVFIKNIKYECDNERLNVTIKNNGLFSIAGFFIYATTSEEQELATEDLSARVYAGGQLYGNAIVFSTTMNGLTPEEPNEKTSIFNLTGLGTIYRIEIVPVRFQEEEGKTRFATCGDAKVGEVVSCYEPTPCGNSVIDSGEECDDGDTNNGDGCSSSCSIETGWSCSGEPSECVKVRVQITYIGFENSGEINNWKEDVSQSVYGESLSISGTDKCSPKEGSYMLSGTGDFDPALVRYNRTAINIAGYEDISIKYSMASEDTEWGDRIEFYYYDGSSWEKCHGTTGRSASGCAGWEDFVCDVSLDTGVTNLLIGVAWETSSTSEHAFWDDINITGMVT